MHLSATIGFSADPEGVATMLADPRYVAAKVEATGALSHTVDIDGAPDAAFTVTTRRAMPTDAIPASFRSFVGPSLEVILVEAWEAPRAGQRDGTVVLEITGAPVRATGTVNLTPDGSGASTQTYEVDITASIPIFGAPVEQAAAAALRAALQAEESVASTWLERR